MTEEDIDALADMLLAIDPTSAARDAIAKTYDALPPIERAEFEATVRQYLPAIWPIAPRYP